MGGPVWCALPHICNPTPPPRGTPFTVQQCRRHPAMSVYTLDRSSTSAKFWLDVWGAFFFVVIRNVVGLNEEKERERREKEKCLATGSSGYQWMVFRADCMTRGGWVVEVGDSVCEIHSRTITQKHAHTHTLTPTQSTSKSALLTYQTEAGKWRFRATPVDLTLCSPGSKRIRLSCSLLCLPARTHTCLCVCLRARRLLNLVGRTRTGCCCDGDDRAACAVVVVVLWWWSSAHTPRDRGLGRRGRNSWTLRRSVCVYDPEGLVGLVR